MDNSGQQAFWNGQAGETWVAYRDDLDRQHEGVLRRLLERAAPATGEAVLDIGCGAGASALAFAQAVGPEGRVLGVDISAPLLEQARERAAGKDTLTFELADAAAYPFSGGFDLAVSRFGVMFFADPVAAFANIARALRPGGRIVFVCWAAAAKNPLFANSFAAIVARFGPMPPADPHAPGPMAFADIPRVVGLLQAAGFVDCAGREETVDLHQPDGLAAVSRLMLKVGPVARAIAEHGGGEVDAEAIRTDILARSEPFMAADGLHLPGRINIFTARV